jgi:hypothetical protein
MSTHASSQKKSGKSASRAQRNYYFRALLSGEWSENQRRARKILSV